MNVGTALNDGSRFRHHDKSHGRDDDPWKYEHHVSRFKLVIKMVFLNLLQDSERMSARPYDLVMSQLKFERSYFNMTYMWYEDGGAMLKAASKIQKYLGSWLA